jgi:hypothetical protein
MSSNNNNVVARQRWRPVKEDGLQRIVRLVSHGLKVVEEGFEAKAILTNLIAILMKLLAILMDLFSILMDLLSILTNRLVSKVNGLDNIFNRLVFNYQRISYRVLSAM